MRLWCYEVMRLWGYEVMRLWGYEIWFNLMTFGVLWCLLSWYLPILIFYNVFLWIYNSYYQLFIKEVLHIQFNECTKKKIPNYHTLIPNYGMRLWGYLKGLIIVGKNGYIPNARKPVYHISICARVFSYNEYILMFFIWWY